MNEKEKQIEEMAWVMCTDCATYTKGCKHHPCDHDLFYHSRSDERRLTCPNP